MVFLEHINFKTDITCSLHCISKNYDILNNCLSDINLIFTDIKFKTKQDYEYSFRVLLKLVLTFSLFVWSRPSVKLSMVCPHEAKRRLIGLESWMVNSRN